MEPAPVSPAGIRTNTSLYNRGGAFTVPDGKGSSDPKVAKGVEALKKEATSVHHLMTQELCVLPQLQAYLMFIGLKPWSMLAPRSTFPIQKGLSIRLGTISNIGRSFQR